MDGKNIYLSLMVHYETKQHKEGHFLYSNKQIITLVILIKSNVLVNCYGVFVRPDREENTPRYMGFFMHLCTNGGGTPPPEPTQVAIDQCGNGSKDYTSITSTFFILTETDDWLFNKHLSILAITNDL